MNKKDKELNIVKKTCKELGVTQKELADMLDVPQSTMSRWQNDNIPKMAKLSLELLIENNNYKKGSEALKTAFKLLNIQN